MGYKTLFLKADNSYKDNVSFEDILELYHFDRKLKMLLFDVLLDIENNLKVNIINQFCSKYGFSEKEYIDKNNYNIHHKYLDKTLTRIGEEISKRSYDSLAMEHYMNNYKFCPLWVAMKFLSFGVVKEHFNILKDDDKFEIRNKIAIDKNLPIKTLFTYIQLLADIRNGCAHERIMFNQVHRRIWIPRCAEHSTFRTQYNRNGNFAVLIAIKNLLDKNDFNNFIDNLSLIINDFLKNTLIITKNDLLAEMHLPMNYENLKW